MKIARMLLGGMAILTLAAGCATTPVQQGAIAGSLLGAGVGAVAGHSVGNTEAGALIGAGAGALTGALIGDSIEHSPPPLEARPVAPPPVVYAPGPPSPAVGYYQRQVVIGPSGERYETRVWKPL